MAIKTPPASALLTYEAYLAEGEVEGRYKIIDGVRVEVLPAAQVERVLRDCYAEKLGDADLEERLLKDVDEEQFRSICRNALEGLATKRLDLEMLVEHRAPVTGAPERVGRRGLHGSQVAARSEGVRGMASRQPAPELPGRLSHPSAGPGCRASEQDRGVCRPGRIRSCLRLPARRHV
jgi:hypothetical protein